MDKQILTTKNGATVTVAQRDGKLHIVDADCQITKDILPDGIYKGEGLSDILVKDGKYVKSQFSLKPGIHPRATKIPIRTISQKMQESREARKKYISDMRFSGKLF